MDQITFKVNGTQHSVGSDVSSDDMLLDYLRKQLQLRGTKYMCREGGCGACIVTASTAPGETPKAVNSCLVSITSCHDWDITTVEKVGNRLDGYHKVQKQLTEDHGSQCGYCSPGWVMAMYSLLQSKTKLSMLEIEKSFGSNICRCTGYRPILQAFKKFATDSPNSLIGDIEDLKICKKNNSICEDTCSEREWCVISDNDLNQDIEIKIKLKDGRLWYRISKVEQIFDILNTEGNESYMLVGGNTAKGAFPIDAYPQVLIDITGVDELKGYKLDQNLIIGAATTLSDTLNIFQSVAKEENFGYLQKLYDHLNLVAHIPVRNIGTLAGNLMTKNKHKEFPSDVFLLLETVGADLTILTSENSKLVVTMQEFFNLDMKGKVLYNIMLPPLGVQYKLVTFKIMPRAQSAKAIVNAGFLYKLSSNNEVQDCRLMFGGLSPNFTRAFDTEKLLTGKSLFENDTLQTALEKLNKEFVVVESPPLPSAAYRKQLALALFYKGLLTLCPEDKIDKRYQSGMKKLHESRPVSQASQSYTTDPTVYPLNKPIEKVEALIQCSGEAKYTDDLNSFPYELHSALVLTTVALGNIENIDSSLALSQPGVVAFYSAKDIPGKNNFIMTGLIVFIGDEEVFCSKEVKYYNQPLGMIVAETAAIAERAAKMVKVTYTNTKKPLLDIKDARLDKTRTTLFLPLPAIGRGFFVNKVFKSNYTIYGQYHFTMETIACVVCPSEQGLSVYSSTQWMDSVQYVVAHALNLDVNSVDVFVSRLGGGFGLKITRSNLAAVACSLAALKLNRPCRMIHPMQSVTRAYGKRLPCSVDVEVRVAKNGLVQYMDYDLYEDNGYKVTEIVAILGIEASANCYSSQWWNYKSYNSTTDNAKNTYCRSPSTLENIAAAETIMEQISYELSLDPYDVRMTNLNITLTDVRSMAEEIYSNAEYKSRRAAVNQFNKDNRWKKRGLRWSFMKYLPLSPAAFEVYLSVCHGDGSVILTHGGIELGQGINTKAIQIAAYFLKIPVEKIKIKGSSTITSPNSMLTGSSITSQSIGMGVEKCCKELLARLAPIKILLLNPSWEILIQKAYALKVDLNVRHFENDILSPLFYVYGITLAEVEVDILTGESEILRVDLLEDVGRSVSPEIDVGQIEGAFIMGLGYWTIEDLVYDKDTGELLTDRTWLYHVPQARDIPQIFNVSFRKKSYSGAVVLGAKVTGEPATCMAVCVPFALREAVSSARKDAGIPTTQWFSIDGPHTTEKLCLSSSTEIKHFKFL